MSTYKNITESGIIKSKGGKIAGIVLNSNSSGTLALVDGLEPSTAAYSTLTSVGACVPASHGQTILTSNGTNVTDGKIVTIGDIVYRFKSTMTAAYDVKRGASAAATLDNLKMAINGTGTAGTNYYAGTEPHPYFYASTNSDTQQTIVARILGDDDFVTAINALDTTTNDATLSWEDTTYGGGTGDSNPAVSNEEALITIGDRVYTETIELSETSGADAVADEILWVTNEATFLDNLKKAINESGIAGTDYSTGTYINQYVKATDNAADSQKVVARLLGIGGNSIVTDETLANYSWTSTELAGGTGSEGEVICSTITLSAVATTGERFIPFYNMEFTRGLYATVGGTLDFTIALD